MRNYWLEQRLKTHTFWAVMPKDTISKNDIWIDTSTSTSVFSTTSCYDDSSTYNDGSYFPFNFDAESGELKKS